MDVEKVKIELVNNQWELTYKGDTKGPGNYQAIKVDRDDGPQFIVFTIQNPDVKFSGEPIWVKEAGKPQQGDKHPQIPTWQVKAGGKKLVVFDWNDNPQPIDLHYQLNFADGKPPLDPVITNGGGGGGQPIYEYSYMEIFGAFVLAVLVAFTLGAFAHKHFMAR